MSQAQDIVVHESDFTNADGSRAPSSCERPDIGCECKSPAEYPPGKLHPWVVRRLQRTIFICEPCAVYMSQKTTTTTRVQTMTQEVPKSYDQSSSC